MLSRIQKLQGFKEVSGLLEIPLGTRTVENLNRAYSASSLLEEEEESKELERDLFDLINVHLSEIPIFRYPAPENSGGELVLGCVAYQTPYPFGLSLNELNQHLLIVGRSGVGKTTLNYILAIQLQRLGIPFWIFDFKKDYRHLTKFFGSEVLVIRAENFKFNPLRPPPGVSIQKWITTFVDVFAHSTGVMYASKSYLMDYAFQIFELYEEGKYPSIYELMEILKSQYASLITKEARYNEVCKNRVKSLIDAMGEILDCSEGFPLNELLNRNVVWEFDSLGEDFKSFLTEIMLAWVFTYRMAQGYRRELSHITVCDEGKLIFSRHKEYSAELGIPIIDILTSQMREFGEGLIVSDQEPGKLTESIKANSFTKICFNLGSGKDIQDMSRCMGLTQEQTDACYHLQQGQAIMKLSGRHTSPFPIIMPQIRIQKNVTDQQIDSLMNPILSGLKVVPRVQTSNYEEHIVGLNSGKKKGKKNEEDKNQKDEKQTMNFLVDVSENPFIPVTERYKKLGLTARRGTDLKTELLNSKFLREVEINFGKRGGRKIFLDLCEAGIEFLRQHKYGIKEGTRGGFEHKFWQNQIREFYEKKGVKVAIEHPIGSGKTVDVVLDEKTAVEVAMNPKHEIENITKCLEAKFDKIFVVCRDEEVRNRVEEQVNKHFASKPDNLELKLVSDYTSLHKGV